MFLRNAKAEKRMQSSALLGFQISKNLLSHFNYLRYDIYRNSRKYPVFLVKNSGNSSYLFLLTSFFPIIF